MKFEISFTYFDKKHLEHGQLDALFNNAGILGAGKIGELDSESFDELVAVNLKSPIFLTQGKNFYKKNSKILKLRCHFWQKQKAQS